MLEAIKSKAWQAGALVLFTSREQMRLAVDALSTAMRSQVLVQTAMPRALLLARHRDAVEMGEPSIIFGMPRNCRARRS